MKILILLGSARPESSTKAMAEAFADGAKSAGNEVVAFDVANMEIFGCKGCEACHSALAGKCVQSDDMAQILEQAKTAQMIVLASPIYYFSMSAQIEAALQRLYPLGGMKSLEKMALLLSSHSAGVYDAAKMQLEYICKYLNVENAGTITSCHSENKTAAKLEECRRFGMSMK